MLRTFNSWSQDGYKIKKGSKHVARDSEGRPLFSEHQVTHRPPPLYANVGGAGHWDATMDECGGPMHGLYGNCD